MAGHTWSRGSATPLLVSLVAMLALQAFFVTGERRTIASLLWLCVLTAGIWSARGRRATMVALVFVLAAAAPRVWFVTHPSVTTMLLTKVTASLFLVYAILHVFRTSVGPAHRPFHDRVAGALTVYLLMGLLGAVLATVIQLCWPGSYAFAPALAHAGAVPPLAEFRFVYFSFVTLATVGYGDITPVSPAAQTLAWMEAVAGQMYVAIVIAALVSLRTSGPTTDGALHG